MSNTNVLSTTFHTFSIDSFPFIVGVCTCDILYLIVIAWSSILFFYAVF